MIEWYRKCGLSDDRSGQSHGECLVKAGAFYLMGGEADEICLMGNEGG